MYVGPWQEYKLMRAINEVKTENDKLKSLMRSGTNSEHSSIPSTPRSNASASKRGGSFSVKQVGASSSYRSNSNRPSSSLKPRPLDKDTLLGTPRSDRSTQSAPVPMSSMYDAEMEQLQAMYGCNPMVQDLVRGAPMTSKEREAQAGQPGFVRRPTGPVRGEELDERIRRRTALSMLYGGDEHAPRHEEPPTRASKPRLIERVRPPSQQQALRQQQQQGPRPTQEGARDVQDGMINRNIVRDLASFYDLHVKQQHQLQEMNLGAVPWDNGQSLLPISLPISVTATSHAPFPTTIQGKYSVPPPPTTTKPLQSTEFPPVVGSGGLLGGGDALQLAMRRRPYDVGPPPGGPVFPGVTAQTTPTLGLAGTSGSVAHTSSRASSSTIEDFIASQNFQEDGLHAHAANILTASMEKRQRPQAAAGGPHHTVSPLASLAKPSLLVSSTALVEAGLDRYRPPPPPTLPADFNPVGAIRTGEALKPVAKPMHDFLAVPPEAPHHLVASPSKQSKNGKYRPSSVATDISMDGDDVGALLQWANSLDSVMGRL